MQFNPAGQANINAATKDNRLNVLCRVIAEASEGVIHATQRVNQLADSFGGPQPPEPTEGQVRPVATSVDQHMAELDTALRRLHSAIDRLW